MGDLRDALERERRRHRMPDGSMEALERRRERRNRNRRVGTAFLALAIAGAGIGAAVVALNGTGEDVAPVGTPTPSITAPVETPTSGPVAPDAVSVPSGPIQFIDSLTGWMAGAHGEILATSDGGMTWTTQYDGPARITAVQFLDGDRGWAVGEDAFLRTADGGATWQPVGEPEEPLHQVQFLSSEVGWGVSWTTSEATFLVGTRDGGTSWQPASKTPGRIDSICFEDEASGWAAGTFVHRTTDGAATWTSEELHPSQDEPWTAVIRCAAGGQAWLLHTDGGAAGHLPYALFSTPDGGSWSPVLQEAGTRPLGQVAGAFDAQDPYPGPLFGFEDGKALFVGWCPACGNSVAAYSTSDRGATWDRTVVVDSGAVPVGMSFVDREHGWLLVDHDPGHGGDRVVLVTSDGGRTWSNLG
jgi:photosystem II stability/assembly factor-like uncharacterized protein